MRVLFLRRRSTLPIWAPALFLCFGVQGLFCWPAGSQQSTSLKGGGVQDVEQSLGPFALGGQNYAVVLHEKYLANAGELQGKTLAAVEIRDVAGNVSYRKDFSYSVEQGHFRQSLSVSAELVSGKTGKGLILHYREQTGVSQTNKDLSREFWQLFGLIDGKLTPLGRPAPIGVPAPGAPFMGVMTRAANDTVSVISQPDMIEVRAWTGSFYVYIPLRVDWNHGGVEQGQRCMEMIGGGLQEVGCDMRVAAVRKPPAGEFSFVRLFAEAHKNMGVPDHVVIQRDSKVEILGSRAIIVWTNNGELIQPHFSDLWLHVGIDNRTGWIHGEDDFAAVGLLAGNPTP